MYGTETVLEMTLKQNSKEAEAGVLQVRTGLSYTVRPHLKQQTNNTKNKNKNKNHLTEKATV